jgi:hypothetical protein
MTTRILLDPDGSALLHGANGYILYEPEHTILPPDRQNVYVMPQRRQFPVPARTGIWVPPRRKLGPDQ